MVGTIFGLGLSQQFDADGDPYVGCKLYIYEAGTSTPVTVYEDYGLTAGLEHPFPIVADSAGRIPAFWLADGSYRVRLTDQVGNEIFDETSITAIGPSSGSSGGGGVSTQVVLQTGDMIATFDEGTRDGWVKMYGSIGNATSSATNRANADCEALFEFLWTNVSDTYATVSGGRGSSASEDWAASKTIDVPDMQGRSFIGLDDMAGGSPAADVVAAAVETAYPGGSEDLTIAEVNLPVHTHDYGTLTVADHAHAAGELAIADHTHTYNDLGDTYSVAAGGAYEVSSNPYYGDEATGVASLTITGNTAAAGPAVTSGETGSTGSGTALASMNPYRAGTWYIKL